MSSYTEVFSGTTLYPSDVSYLALALTANTTLSWPLESNTGANVIARIIDVTPTAAYAITMPPANQTGNGQVVLFNNLGPYTVTVLDSTGGTLMALLSGEVWELYLTSNATAAGLWRTFKFGAATASAQASALAGYGLKANSSLLEQDYPATSLSGSYTVGAADRAGLFLWTGGVGTLSLLAAATAANGFFVSVRNSGTGAWTIDPAGSELINGSATLVLQPGDSASVYCNGSAWYTVGFGQNAVFAFDYTSVSLTGQSSPYTLSGAELNRVAYSFTGTLIANTEVVVPTTIQQYWLSNDTTGAYTLGFRTAAQSPAVTLTQGARGIFYSNGTNVVNADTASVAVPLAVSGGGTGSTTASGARTNLGGTSVGIAVFTAASAAAARVAVGSPSTDDANAFAVAVS
jgi:hypothetical protein